MSDVHTSIVFLYFLPKEMIGRPEFRIYVNRPEFRPTFTFVQ